MATITLKGSPFQTIGELPAVGTAAPAFNLRTTDLATISLEDFKGAKVILNIFPSVDTGTCATSVRTFNKEAANLDNTKVICVSRDLPFAHGRFCGAEGIENVVSASDITGAFSEAYGLKIAEGPLAELSSRSVVVIDETGKVIYTEQVAETVDEPNYAAALEALK